MKFLRNKENEDIKPILDLTPKLKEKYGKNYQMINAINQNTKALEDIAKYLKEISEKLNK